MALKRIISFSLWGSSQFYNIGALANIVEAAEVYPGWICRFYVHNQSPVIDALRASPCEVVPMPLDKAWLPLYWRFNAASDQDVEYVIFRDCDSRVNWREAGAVAEWIESGANAHLMKDWPAPHATETILAGMWGLRGGVITNMPELINNWVCSTNLNNKYTDQEFLRGIIWPLVKNSVMNHGVNSPAGPARPFPPHKPMKYGEYVGQPIQI